MDQIKSKKHVFSKLFPFFKPYLIPLIGGFVLIFFAAVFTAAAPITEGLITTQLTSDAKDIIAHVPGAGVNFRVHYLCSFCVGRFLYCRRRMFLCLQFLFDQCHSKRYV